MEVNGEIVYPLEPPKKRADLFSSSWSKNKSGTSKKKESGTVNRLRLLAAKTNGRYTCFAMSEAGHVHAFSTHDNMTHLFQHKVVQEEIRRRMIYFLIISDYP